MTKSLPRRRLSLLASSSLVVTSLVAGVGAFGAVTFAPGEALAACAGENTASVVCDAATPATAGTVTTTYVNAVPNISASVRVNPGAAITTGGLTVTQTGDVGELLVYVDDPAGITNLAGAAVSVSNTTGGQTTFNNQGGAITATTNGVVITTGAAALPTTSVNVTTGAISAGGSGVIATSAGPAGVDVTGAIVAGGTGVFVQTSGTGNAAIAVNANVTGSSGGVAATATGTGGVTITSAAGTVIRGDGNYGVLGQSVDGNVTLVINGDVGTALNPTGFDAIRGASNGAGNVSVTATGDVFAGFAGVQATTTGTGSVYVEFGNDAGDSITASSAAIGAYIDNGLSTATATAVVNSGATLNANGGVYVFNSGSGAATANLFDNVTINGALSGLSVDAGTGDATVNIGSGLSITLADVFGAVNSEGIYVESNRAADQAAGDEAVEISVGANASIIINGVGLDSDSSAGMSAVATGANGGIEAGVQNGHNISLIGTNTQGITAQTVGGVINISTGTGTITLTAADTTDTIGDFSSATGIGAVSTTGAITLTSASNINVLMADTSATGISAVTGGAGTVSVTSFGTILSSGGGISTSTGDGANFIVNQGAVTANGGNGLSAVSSAGNINIANTADITSATNTGIAALNLGTGPSGAIVVNSFSGAITAGGDGINVSNVGAANAGLIYVQNVGMITANTAGGGGFGIYAQQAGDGGVIIQSVGAIAGSAGTGIFVAGNGTTGLVNIIANGGGIGSAGDAVSNTGIGAYQYNAAGAGGVSVLANGFAGIYAGQFGIDARNLGAGNVTVNVGASNPIVTTGAGSVGINTVAGVGSTDIDLAAAITSGGTGINAVSGDGSITIDTTAGGTINATGDGIFASSTGGIVVATTAGSITSTTGDGVQIQATGAGSANIINTATVSSGRHGLYAFSQTSSVVIANSATITANTTGGSFSGILGSSNSGPVTIVLNGGTNIAGTASDGIVAQTIFGGDVLIANGGAISIGSAGDFTEGVGIRAEALGLTDGHDATVFLQAPAAIFSVDGGINAEARGVSAVNLLISGNSSIVTSGANSYGLRAASGGGSIQVAAPLTANITSAGSGIVTVNSGAGSTVIAASGNVNAAGVGLAGISATSGSGLTVITAGNGITIAGTAGSGIRTNSAGGAVIVGVGTGGAGVGTTLVTGLGSGANGWVVDLNNAAGGTSTLNIAANGVVRSAEAGTSGYDDLAIRGIGGALVINNGGRINGVVNAAGATSLVFNNSSLNSWHTTGTSIFSAGADTLNNTGAIFTNAGGAATTLDFGAGADTFANSGLLVVGEPALTASTLTVTGLEAWTNSGRIVFGSSGTTLTALSDGQINDRILSAGTTFTGSGSSRLVMDASLGATTQASCAVLTAADCFGLTGGSTAGATQILVNDIGGANSGALNTAGIVLVDVSGAGTTAASNFSLDPTSAGWRADANSSDGVIDKGLFVYDLVLDGKQHKLVGLPDADVFEFSTIGTAAQNAWYTTTGVWLDRQADLRQQVDGIEGTGAGVWMKITGSAGERDRTSSYDVLGTTYSFDTSYDQNSVALIGGLDIMGGGSGKAWVIGGQIGYVDSDVNYDASSTVTSLEGMTFGLYGTYVSGSFFVDGIINANRLDYDHQNITLAPAGANVFSGEINSLGVQVEGGWTIPLGANGFFEPLASVSWLNTEIDSATVPGSVVEWDDQTSLRASLGGRLGLNADHGAFSSQWAVTARYWNEFEGDNGLTIDSAGADLDIRDDVSGSFGELGASLNVFSADERFSGFVSVGTKFNDDFTSVDASLGIRWRW